MSSINKGAGKIKIYKNRFKLGYSGTVNNF